MLLIVSFWLGYALLGTSLDVPGDALALDLFEIARSKDDKTIHYQVNLNSDNSIDQNDPINIFWEVPTAKGVKTHNLTWIQNKYAYGIKILSQESNSLSFHFVSYPDKIIKIRQNEEGIYQAYTLCEDRPILVENIFIQIDGGTFWVPNVTYVKISGKNPDTQQDTFEIIQP